MEPLLRGLEAVPDLREVWSRAISLVAPRRCLVGKLRGRESRDRGHPHETEASWLRPSALHHLLGLTDSQVLEPACYSGRTPKYATDASSSPSSACA
jgi:hypothetical protein